MMPPKVKIFSVIVIFLAIITLSTVAYYHTRKEETVSVVPSKEPEAKASEKQPETTAELTENKQSEIQTNKTTDTTTSTTKTTSTTTPATTKSKSKQTGTPKKVQADSNKPIPVAPAVMPRAAPKIVLDSSLLDEVEGIVSFDIDGLDLGSLEYDDQDEYEDEDVSSDGGAEDHFDGIEYDDVASSQGSDEKSSFDEQAASLTESDEDEDEPTSLTITSDPSSFKGTLLFTSLVDNSDCVMMLDTDTGITTQISGVEDGTNRLPDNEDRSPKYSPDGKYIAFSRAKSDRGADQFCFKIFLMETDGIGAKTIIVDDSRREDFEFTPDSKGLIYISRAHEVKLVDLADRSNFKNLTTDRIFNKYLPVISADSKYLYFAVNNGLGYEIHRKNLENYKSKPEIVFKSKDHFREFKISPDGNRILISYCVANAEQSKVLIYNMITKKITRPFGDLYDLNGCFWSFDGKYVFSVKQGDENAGLLRVDIDNPTAQILLVIPDFKPVFAFSIKPPEDMPHLPPKVPVDDFLEARDISFQDRIIYSTLSNDSDQKHVIESLNMSTMVRTQLTGTEFDPDRSKMVYDFHPKYSPNGDFIAFGRTSQEWSDPSYYPIYLMKVDGTEIERIGSCTHDFNFTPDGTAIVYNDVKNGSNVIIKADIHSQSRKDDIVLLTSDKTKELRSPVLTANEKYLYYLDKSVICRKDLENSESTDAEWTFETGIPNLISLQLAPTEDKLFVRSRPEWLSPFVTAMFDFESETLIFLPENFKGLFWSRDGNGIYAERLGDKAGLVYFKLENGALSRPEMKIPSFSSTSSASLNFKTVPYDKILEDFNETVIFAAKNAIMSFDAATSTTKYLTQAPNGLDFDDSFTDQKLIAFCKFPHSLSFDNPAIYLKSKEEEEPRKVVECKTDEFDFTPDDAGIVYLDLSGKICQIDLQTGIVSEIVLNHEKKIVAEDENVNDDESDEDDILKYDAGFVYDKLAVFNNYLYYCIVNIGIRSDIWRKDLTDENSIPELVYKDNNSYNAIKEFTVSPDGKEILISIDSMSNYYRDRVIILEIGSDLDTSRTLFELNMALALEGFFWSQDGQWIYAQMTKGNVGLVRFKANETATNPDPEMVIPFFESNSRAALFSKNI